MTLFGSIGKFIHELFSPSYRVERDGNEWRIVDRAGKLIEDGFLSEDAAKRRIPQLGDE